MGAVNAGQRLGAKRIIGFTVGDYAFNLYWQSVSLYLLFFYTDAVGLSAATAGLIYMIASIFDAAIDPIMGAIADRTRTRWGRYRPYILGGTPLVAIAFMLLYYRPPFEGVWLAAWMLGAHIIFRLAYTIVSIPFTALSARITSDSGERSVVAGGRIIFATLAGFTVAYFTQPLAERFGDDDPATGFFWAAAIFAVVASIVLPIVFFATQEPAETGEDRSPHNLGEYWVALRENRALWAMVLAACAGVICSTAIGKSILYYFKYYVGDENGGRLALTLAAASGLAVVPCWVMVTKWIGKRNAWFAAVVLGLMGLATFAMFDVRSTAGAITFFLWMQVAGLGIAFGFWSILPDTVEYGEWRTGLRTESFVFGLGQFFLKVALGLGAGLYGWLLERIGYRANMPQTAETLANMKLLMTALPAVGLVLAGAIMIFYPLRGRMHEQIVREIAERRSSGRVSPE
ncbi:MFS transporter [Hephaestia sp. GCM10023244]|uniref:MFS transporter n=1 Tax=Hephaestia sp. GCM10023244 TaxID=3252641 RepID=UPI0036186C17